jgi:hypothetical protein
MRAAQDKKKFVILHLSGKKLGMVVHTSVILVTVRSVKQAGLDTKQDPISKKNRAKKKKAGGMAQVVERSSEFKCYYWRERQTDRHTHTHTHTQRERERERKRERDREIEVKS